MTTPYQTVYQNAVFCFQAVFFFFVCVCVCVWRGGGGGVIILPTCIILKHVGKFVICPALKDNDKTQNKGYTSQQNILRVPCQGNSNTQTTCAAR